LLSLHIYLEISHEVTWLHNVQPESAEVEVQCCCRGDACWNIRVWNSLRRRSAHSCWAHGNHLEQAEETCEGCWEEPKNSRYRAGLEFGMGSQRHGLAAPACRCQQPYRLHQGCRGGVSGEPLPSRPRGIGEAKSPAGRPSASFSPERALLASACCALRTSSQSISPPAGEGRTPTAGKACAIPLIASHALEPAKVCALSILRDGDIAAGKGGSLSGDTD